jgi:mRNA interferase MazF
VAVRGEIYELCAGPQAKGHEPQGRRYAVVVQTDHLTLSTVIAAPTSTSARDAHYPQHRFGRRVGRVSPAEQQEIDRAVTSVLGLF